MSTTTPELKAALPADFLGEPADTMRWMKAISAYFLINASIYNTDEQKITLTLNKMSKGREVPFSKMWYDKLANTTVAATEKTFEKFVENFNTTFFPFDTKATARFELTKLAQKAFKRSDGITDDGFQKYITDFQNLSARAGITDEVTLIDQFSLGLDQQLTTMILSMATSPTTVTAWIEQAKTFHAQKMHILALKEGRLPFSSYLSTPRTTSDPNAMDVDAITLSKLAPTERAKCICEGRCFRCQLPGHNTSQCKKNRNPRPQNICAAETDPSSSTPLPVDTKVPSSIDVFVNSLKTQGKNKAEILQVLQMCFEEPKEEITVVSTLDKDF